MEQYAKPEETAQYIERAAGNVGVNPEALREAITQRCRDILNTVASA